MRLPGHLAVGIADEDGERAAIRGPTSLVLKGASASGITANSSGEGEAVSSNSGTRLAPFAPPHGAEGEQQDADAGEPGKERQRVDALQDRLVGHADHHAIVVGDADLAAHR